MTTDADRAPDTSPEDGSIFDRWVNPATLRGAALAAAGFLVLALPDASAIVIRLILGIALVVLGLLDGWAAIRAPDTSIATILLAIATVVAGLVVLVVAREAFTLIIQIAGVWLIARGIVIAGAALRNRGAQETWVFDLVRGLLSIAAGGVLFVVPSALVSAVFIIGALIAIAVGAIIISFGVGNEDRDDLGTAELGGMIVRWFRARDVGPEMRADVVDNLFFEPPDAKQKQIGFWTLLVLSVIIATLGVLADSTAVVIGAMLVAPLMTPIMAVSAAIVNGWARRLMTAFATVLGGVVVAIGVAWIISVWAPQLVPLASNAQITSRTSPTLIDLMIAMAAGAAGAYATVDKRVSSSITGVAIAVALVPPLGVVGVTLHATAWGDAWGAFLLFLTNLVSIILVASIVFFVTGLAPFREIRENQRKMRTVIATVVLAAIVIMVPLAFTSNGIISSATRQSEARSTVEEWLDGTDIDVDRVTVSGDLVDVEMSGEGTPPSVSDLEASLEESLGADVSVTVEFTPSEFLTSDS